MLIYNEEVGFEWSQFTFSLQKHTFADSLKQKATTKKDPELYFSGDKNPTFGY